MKAWTETGIGIVFFTGLFIAAITGILVIIFLRPVKKPAEKIAGNYGWAWMRTFLTTVLIASLIGALSVSFRNCGGDYNYLLESRKETVMKGMEQVSSSFNYMAFTLGIWLLLFISLFIFYKKRSENPGN